MGYSDGPYVNKAYPAGVLGAGCAMSDGKVMTEEMEQKMRQAHRVYEFWSAIQQLDNFQRELRSLNFIGHDKALNDVMDDLVKQWMKERRHALENT